MEPQSVSYISYNVNESAHGCQNITIKGHYMHVKIAHVCMSVLLMSVCLYCSCLCVCFAHVCMSILLMSVGLYCSCMCMSLYPKFGHIECS